MSGGPDPAEDEDEAALRWAQAESLKQTQDAGLPDAMLESELRQAARLSLRQSQADAERLRQQEEEELERAMQASLQSAPPPRAAAILVRLVATRFALVATTSTRGKLRPQAI